MHESGQRQEEEREGEGEEEREGEAGRVVGGERVTEISVEDEMKSSYIDYAMSVIVGRALPDARDGLKPVHRRILFGMHGLGSRHDRPHKKSARIVGEILGKYHPHGDAAVYDTLARMAQDFSYRYPLIDGQGNFGSLDGDAPASMRYTEARLSKISEELLTDLEKETVSWSPNFDNTLKEPQVLPAKFPNLLVNGSSGIAVGMATNMPPHNLGEVVDAVVKVIDEPGEEVEELMQTLRGPDFPTGGIISGYEGIKNAYTTGRGSLTLKARVEVEKAEKKGRRERLVVTEIPYQVNKSSLVAEIAEFVKTQKLESVTGLRDESDRKGMRIVVELRAGADAAVVLNKLYKHTRLQTTFGVINLALVDGEPRVLTLKELIECFVKHRREVTVRRLRYELERAEKRCHILEGLVVAISQIDETIKLIKSAPDSKTAKAALVSRFGLSEEQVKEILEMKLSRLSALERGKIETERAELEARINWRREVLASESRIFGLVKDELAELKAKYGDARRTEIEEEKAFLSERDLVEEAEVVLFFTQRGYLKRLPANIFKQQRRGGKGISVLEKKEGDTVLIFARASTRERLLLFTESGRAYQVKTYQIPPTSSRHAKGRPLVNIPGQELREEKNENEKEKEKIAAVIPIPEDLDRAVAAARGEGAAEGAEDSFLVFATRQGVVKRTTLASLKSVRVNGVVAVKVRSEKGDSLAGVALVRGGGEQRRGVILSSKNGKAILFEEAELREMGRYAAGVRGMRLEKGDEIASVEAVDLGLGLGSSTSREVKRVVTVTEKGYGKRTRLDAYRETHRGGKGVISIRTGERNGRVVCVKQVRNADELMISTSDGLVTKIAARNIPTQGRNTYGVRLMNVKEGEKVVGVEVFSAF